MTSVRAVALSAGLVLVGALAGACTADSDADADPADGQSPGASSSPGAEPEPSVTLTRPDARLDLDIAQIQGGVPPSARHRLAQEIAQPITGWIDEGFLVDDYPRKAFADAFDTWTTPAAMLAERDDDVTTMSAQGEDLVALVADRQRVRLYVFAVGGEPGGATARVLLKLTGERSDGDVRHYEVSGELFLTPVRDSWQIFGYDLHQQVRP